MGAGSASHWVTSIEWDAAVGVQCLCLLRDIEWVDSEGLHGPKVNITSQACVGTCEDRMMQGANDAMASREENCRDDGVRTGILQTAHTAEHTDP